MERHVVAISIDRFPAQKHFVRCYELRGGGKEVILNCPFYGMTIFLFFHVHGQSFHRLRRIYR